MSFGLFVNIGAARQALAPTRQLEKEPSDYNVGDKLSLIVTEVNVTGNKLTVGCKDLGDTDGDGKKTRIQDLYPGLKVSGTVKGIREFGAFIDIGLRKEALMPTALQDPEAGAIEEGQELELFVHSVDPKKLQVTVGANKPSADKLFSARQPREKVPPGMCIRDPRMHKLFYEVFDKQCDLYVPDNEMERSEAMERFPGMFHVTEKENSQILANGMGFNYRYEVAPAFSTFIPIPVHLRKEDAQMPDDIQALTHSTRFEEVLMGETLDVGIKPEIHVKYRHPPLNDPNYTFHPEYYQQLKLKKEREEEKAKEDSEASARKK